MRTEESVYDERENATPTPLLPTAPSQSPSGVTLTRSDSGSRSIASTSVYSRQSILDAEESAEFRDSFLRRVEAEYGLDIASSNSPPRRQPRWRVDDGQEDIPAVPELPASLRGAKSKAITGSGRGVGVEVEPRSSAEGEREKVRRGILKGSSPYMF